LHCLPLPIIFDSFFLYSNTSLYFSWQLILIKMNFTFLLF
jgi:hypothetical protein